MVREVDQVFIILLMWKPEDKTMWVAGFILYGDFIRDYDLDAVSG
jgi:hypothetical protein